MVDKRGGGEEGRWREKGQLKREEAHEEEEDEYLFSFRLPEINLEESWWKDQQGKVGQ